VPASTWLYCNYVLIACFCPPDTHPAHSTTPSISPLAHHLLSHPTTTREADHVISKIYLVSFLSPPFIRLSSFEPRAVGGAGKVMVGVRGDEGVGVQGRGSWWVETGSMYIVYELVYCNSVLCTVHGGHYRLMFSRHTCLPNRSPSELQTLFRPLLRTAIRLLDFITITVAHPVNLAAAISQPDDQSRAQWADDLIGSGGLTLELEGVKPQTNLSSCPNNPTLHAELRPWSI